jgi:hypothetical protein
MGQFEQLPILKTQKAMLIKGAGAASRKQDTICEHPAGVTYDSSSNGS